MYQERYNNIKLRLENAITAHCYHVARARVKELAKLVSEHEGSDFRTTYLQLSADFNVPPYQSYRQKTL